MCKHTTVIQLDADRWVCEDCGADAADFIHSSKLSTLSTVLAEVTAKLEAANADQIATSLRLEGESKNVEAALVQIAEQAKQYNELYTERSNLLYRLDKIAQVAHDLDRTELPPGAKFTALRDYIRTGPGPKPNAAVAGDQQLVLKAGTYVGDFRITNGCRTTPGCHIGENHAGACQSEFVVERQESKDG